MKEKKRILVAPLDWGLGHATRCIPIIHHIIASGHEPLIAADGRAYDLLKAEFPGIQMLRLKGYHPIYPEKSKMVFTMMMQTPGFLRTIFREHLQLQQLIEEHRIDAVISDNRYGLWTKKVSCIFLSHQIFIKMPSWAKIMEPGVNRLNHFFISRYDKCWVPDMEKGERLSGELSREKNLPPNVKYIGILSRFENSGVKENYENDLLVILSGPEPQRSIFEEILIRQIKKTSLRAIIVRGITENSEEVVEENIRMVSSGNAKVLNRAILNSKTVIARSGYSNVMDLVYLKKSAILVPTPGQTEQEYLAKSLSAKKYFYSQNQDSFDLQKALKELESCRIPEELNLNKNQFRKTLDDFLSGL